MDAKTDTSLLNTNSMSDIIPEAQMEPTRNDEAVTAAAGVDIPELEDCHSIHESEASETSTLAYSHTPFEEFKPRVEKLCKSLWPHSLVDIERMRGGGFNRIVGLTVHPSPKKALLRKLKHAVSRILHPRRRHQTTLLPKRYILRIPRYLSARIDHESAQTTFVRKTTPIPVPEVFMVDLGAQNALEERYTIQRRLPGTNLDTICEDLTHAQKKVLARSLGQTLTNLHKNPYPCPGQLDPRSGANIMDYPLDNFRQPHRSRPPLAEPQTGLEMILRRLDQWSDCYSDNSDLVPYADLKSMVIELNEETGILASKEHFLCHLDLQPRNILVDVSDPDRLDITGVLDWDEAIFAPRVVGCEPPLWLWRLHDCKTMEEEELQRTSGETPTDAHAKEIKEIFDEAVGPDYVKLAYSHESNIARRLCGWAVNGDVAYKGWEVEAAQQLINDWEQSHGRPTKFIIRNKAPGGSSSPDDGSQHSAPDSDHGQPLEHTDEEDSVQSEAAVADTESVEDQKVLASRG